MYLVVKKTKRTPHSKIIDQTTLAFANFNLLEQFILREGLDNCTVYDAKRLTFKLAENPVEELEDVSE